MQEGRHLTPRHRIVRAKERSIGVAAFGDAQVGNGVDVSFVNAADVVEYIAFNGIQTQRSSKE